MKVIEPKLTANAKKIVEKRYLRTDMKGNLLETTGEMMARVAKHLAKAEINWGDADTVEQVASEFYQVMTSLKLIPGGKSLFEAGNPGGTGQLSSCFVLPIEDDMKQIFKTLGDAALVHKNNGGTGFNFSKIRPHGDKVKNVPGAASGPVDFLSAYSAALGKILQGSKRRGANIGILNCDHPDIVDFITMKDEDGTIKNFNISVGVTNAFFEAVEQDKMWELKNPRSGEVVTKIRAQKLFNLIAEHAWATGDPGLAFLDRMQEDNPTPTIGKIDATNPCGEIPLLPYESCNLASIVLNNHVTKKNDTYTIDWQELEKTIKTGIRLLDNMIEVNTYALPEIENMVKNGNRRIGLGVMGFAHLLYKLGIPYDSKEAVRLAERLAKFIRRKSEEMSLKLGQERGVFPNWDISIYAGTAETYRNCALNMIAPTGTISMMANCSSGIEPVFSLVTKRRTFFEDDKNSHPTEELLMVDPVFKNHLKSKGLNKKQIDDILFQVAEENSLKNIDQLTKEEKKLFTTTHHIRPKWHIEIQAAWQKYFDNSVSKTVNFANNATVDDVKEAYLQAWKQGCKGITIYRDGSKQDQVLNLSNSKPVKKAQAEKPANPAPQPETEPKSEGYYLKKKYLTIKAQANGKNGKPEIKTEETKDKNICPECGAPINDTDGNKFCYSCGYSQTNFSI